MSMYERIMNNKIYQRNPDTNKLDERVVVKLIKNYRTHPDILKIFNELFYNNEIISCAEPGNADFVLCM